MNDKRLNELLIQAIVKAGIQIMGQRGYKVFGPYDITSPQHSLLYMLGDHPEGISFREMGEHLMVSKANIGGLMARLEKKGLAIREQSREDGRVWLAKITPRGKKLLKEVKPFREKADAYVFTGLTRTEKREFLDYLDKTLLRLKFTDVRHPSTHDKEIPKSDTNKRGRAHRSA
jgi:MarR family 2-MHQ and catechol resistance regulon transcriptional repressor